MHVHFGVLVAWSIESHPSRIPVVGHGNQRCSGTSGSAESGSGGSETCERSPQSEGRTSCGRKLPEDSLTNYCVFIIYT